MNFGWQCSYNSKADEWTVPNHLVLNSLCLLDYESTNSEPGKLSSFVSLSTNSDMSSSKGRQFRSWSNTGKTFCSDWQSLLFPCDSSLRESSGSSLSFAFQSNLYTIWRSLSKFGIVWSFGFLKMKEQGKEMGVRNIISYFVEVLWNKMQKLTKKWKFFYFPSLFSFLKQT